MRATRTGKKCEVCEREFFPKPCDFDRRIACSKRCQDKRATGRKKPWEHAAGPRKHGCSHRGRETPEYRTWKDIKKRCYDTHCIGYHDYGARGINVCERWRENFPAFLADMGQKPTPEHSIDRIDNNGNYEPGNCRWATRKVQNRNKGNNRIIEFNGHAKSLAEWAEELGMNYMTLYNRLRLGWSVERAFTALVGVLTQEQIDKRNEQLIAVRGMGAKAFWASMTPEEHSAFARKNAQTRLRKATEVRADIGLTTGLEMRS